MVLPVPSNTNSDAKATLIIMVGTNIDSYETNEHLKNLIKNFDRQINYSGSIKLYLSLSYDKNILSNNPEELCELAHKRGHRIFIQTHWLENFQHYGLMIKKLNQDIVLNNFQPNLSFDKIWVAFSTGNDLWENNRISIYQSIVEKLSSNEYSNVTSFSCINSNEENVDTCCARLLQCNNFFKNANEQQLRNKFCIYYFIKFLTTFRNNNSSHMIFSIKGNTYDCINCLTSNSHYCYPIYIKFLETK